MCFLLVLALVVIVAPLGDIICMQFSHLPTQRGFWTGGKFSRCARLIFVWVIVLVVEGCVCLV